MKKIKEVLRADVRIDTSHLWIIGLGAVVAIGFLIDCFIAPIWPEFCNKIDYEELVYSAGIIVGLEATRKYALTRFKYLNDFAMVNSKKNTPEDILKEKLWVPCVGWCLVLGYAVNIMLIPFISGIEEVDWGFLHYSVSMFLVVSGLREYGVYSKAEEQMINDASATPLDEPKDDKTDEQ